MTKLFTLCGLTLAVSILSFSSFAQRGPQGPVQVIAAPVMQKDFADRIEALGTTRANETVVITANASEKITAIHFEDGQQVSKGDLLVSLDQSEEQAELEAAQAMVSEAQSSYNRAKGLQNSNALSQAALQERQATLKQNQAMIGQINARIENRSIHAPFDGILGLRQVSVGTLVQPGDEITTIDDLSVIKVDFNVPSLYLTALQPGMKVIGTAEAFSDREFEGEVRTINTQVDPVTRTIKVRAVISNPDMILKPGLLMTITLLKDQRQALIAPEEALIKQGETDYVYIVDQAEGKTIARKQAIKTGARQPGIVEVIDGLAAGDQIVAHGTLKISDGSEITVRAIEDDNQTLDELLEQNLQDTAAPAAGNAP